MSTAEVDRLRGEVAGELETVLKADSRHALREAQTPLLDICADAVASTVSDDEALTILLEAAIEGVQEETERRALECLFLGPQRWEPLATRGAAAAAELGVTYDTLRRRNRNGKRRLDALLNALAEAVVAHCPLEELVDSQLLVGAPNPGEDLFEKASLFLSYARADDEHERGVVPALREALVSEFRFQTGQELYVFHDKTNIDPGENWRRRLEEEIDRTRFLLVLLTPSYLKSETCREELARFLEREEAAGRDDLVLPIYYATLTEQALSDPLAVTLLERQHIDWRGLRFQELHSPPVRMAIAELAGSVASALARTPGRHHRSIAELVTEDVGVVERLSRMERAQPRFVRSLVALNDEQEGVTAEVTQAGEDLERLKRRGRGASAALIVARRLSSKLEPHADRMEEIAEEIRRDLDAIGEGVSAFAAEVPHSTEEGVDEAIRHARDSLSSAFDASKQASDAIRAMGASYEEAGKMASTLRPVLRRLLRGISVVDDCQMRMREWLDVLELAIDERAKNSARS